MCGRALTVHSMLDIIWTLLGIGIVAGVLYFYIDIAFGWMWK